MNKTTIWILIVIVVVVGIILLNGKSKTPGIKTETGTEAPVNPAASESVNLKPATGNIDDMVSSILSEANDDVQAPADTDTSLTAPEDFSGLDQSLDTSGIQ